MPDFRPDYKYAGNLADPLARYKLTDYDDSGAVQYFGYIEKAGKWFIMEHNTTNKTYRYSSGNTGYTTNWTGRAGLTYAYYNAAF